MRTRKNASSSLGSPSSKLVGLAVGSSPAMVSGAGLVPDRAPGQDSLDRVGAKGADRTDERGTEEAEQQRRPAAIGQGPDKESQRGTTGERPGQSAEQHCRIQQARAQAKPGKLPFLPEWLDKQPIDAVGDPVEPGGEHVQERCEAREKEHRSQGELHDLRRGSERRIHGACMRMSRRTASVAFASGMLHLSRSAAADTALATPAH